jgi:hypothetical protein
MKYIINYYLLGQVVIIIIIGILLRLIHCKRISHRTARWITTGMNLLQAIPAILTVGWYFGIFITIVQISIFYYILWGTEQIDIELAKKKQREEKVRSAHETAPPVVDSQRPV